MVQNTNIRVKVIIEGEDVSVRFVSQDGSARAYSRTLVPQADISRLTCKYILILKSVCFLILENFLDNYY